MKDQSVARARALNPYPIIMTALAAAVALTLILLLPQPARASSYPNDWPQQAISERQALDIAVQHANVSGETPRDVDIEPDRERGVFIYEIEFKLGNLEFEYEIDALSGAVRKWEREENIGGWQDDRNLPGGLISQDQAMQIALDHAGVSANQARVLNQSFYQRHGGFYYYDLVFMTGSHKFIYLIDAATGQIREYKKISLNGR